MKLNRLRVVGCFLFLFFSVGAFQILFGNSELKNILNEPKNVDENGGNSSVPEEQVGRLRATQTVISSSIEKSSIYSQPVAFFADVVPTHLPAPTPTGTIEFKIDNDLVATETLVNGKAKFTISSLSPTHFKQHYVSASYSGDQIFESSRDYWNIWVYPAQTTSHIRAWPSSSMLNQPVNLTVTIDSDAPAKATPNGPVEIFFDGVSFAKTELDANGKVVFSTEELPVGKHTITAIYSGNENFQTSQTNLVYQVDKALTKIDLTSSENPSVFGQALVFTVKVTSPAGTPAGRVQLKINDSLYGNPLYLDSNGQTTTTFKDLISGTYTIEADYVGDANFTSSNVFLTQVIGLAKTNMNLTSSENPANYGTAVKMTAEVVSETVQPIGWVRFKIDGKEFGGTQVLPRSGQVSIFLDQLSANSHHIEAEYSGTQDILPSANSLVQQIKKVKTDLSLTSSENPSTYGIGIKVTAKLTSETVQPTGGIQFKVDGKEFGSLQVFPRNGQVSLSFNQLTAGSHQIEADYQGNENFNTSQSILTQEVNKADTSIKVESSANPSILGESVTFTATVIAKEKLTGTIQFQIDGENSSQPLAVNESNQATLTISKGIKKGEQQVIAVYSGDENYKASTSLPLTQIGNLAIFPPALVTGFQVNNPKGTDVKWINILRWKPPTEGQDPVAYHIYRDEALKTLIATIPAGHELEFIDSIRKQEPFYTYFIISLDAAGNQSKPAILKVTPVAEEPKSS